MRSPSGEQFEIAFAEHRAVAVEVGGGLRTYTVDGEDLIDGYGADEMATGGRGQVLIPWPNRLQDGSYEFDGRLHQLPLNEKEHSNAIHDESYPYLMVFTGDIPDVQRQGLAVEPMTCPPNAFRSRRGSRHSRAGRLAHGDVGTGSDDRGGRMTR